MRSELVSKRTWMMIRRVFFDASVGVTAPLTLTRHQSVKFSFADGVLPSPRIRPRHDSAADHSFPDAPRLVLDLRSSSPSARLAALIANTVSARIAGVFTRSRRGESCNSYSLRSRADIRC